MTSRSSLLNPVLGNHELRIHIGTDHQATSPHDIAGLTFFLQRLPPTREAPLEQQQHRPPGALPAHLCPASFLLLPSIRAPFACAPTVAKCSVFCCRIQCLGALSTGHTHWRSLLSGPIATFLTNTEPAQELEPLLTCDEFARINGTSAGPWPLGRLTALPHLQRYMNICPGNSLC